MASALASAAPASAAAPLFRTAGQAAAAAGAYARSIASAAVTLDEIGRARHWRNARTHASRDPVAWKYHHIGNYMLNDVLPPNHGQL